MTSSTPRTTFSPEPHLLTPEDAYYSSPPRHGPRAMSAGALSNGPRGLSSSSTHTLTTNVAPSSATSTGIAKSPSSTSLALPGAAAAGGRRSRSRRRRSGRDGSVAGGASRQWKKLLWTKQPYPDNYTDPSTFLSHLQWNPRLQAYDFWPLVADSTVIVQHVCAVALFVCCFVGIYQERVSPVSVVGTATACTFVGWVMWDAWLGRVDAGREKERDKDKDNQGGEKGTDAGMKGAVGGATENGDTPSMDGSMNGNAIGSNAPGLGITTPTSLAGSSMPPSKMHSRNPSSTSLSAISSNMQSTTPAVLTPPPTSSTSLSSSTVPNTYQPYSHSALLSIHNQQRLATAKSALLITLALLGLSPILKSLTQSTTSDSIWAMSFWLLLINIFTFDYGGDNSTPAFSSASPSPSATRFPASLSTNAALMASTVLASRLPHTTHVFSLTLFSIEVFGLFPVFRRALRARSFALHVLLTVLLILASGAALGITLITGASEPGGSAGLKDGSASSVLTAAAIGCIVWGFGAIVAMGGCSWWLIGLQRYKNVVIGPWDAARPIIRAGAWD